MTKYAPEDLIQGSDFELLKEIDHRRIKAFIMEQIYQPTYWLRWYGYYQLVMIVLYLLLVSFCVRQALNGNLSPLWWMMAAIVFSVTVLVVLHELFHAIAFWGNGIKQLKMGAIWRKFIFYIAADRQVVDFRVFRRVALAPFVIVNLLTIITGFWFWSSPSAYFSFGIMCIHSLFCAGDVAMLSFYERHPDRVIYNFDDLTEGKTFFYALKKQS